MHKLTKGLKKTKKKKKSKKKGEEELFDSAELEEYRRTQQQRQEEGQSQNQEGGAQGAEADEWQQFKALTAGVDSVLKKTQGDLDRIRSTSYFQRKKTASEQQQQQQQDEKKQPAAAAPPQSSSRQEHHDKDGKLWVGFEEGAPVDLEEEVREAPVTATSSSANLLGAEPAHHLEESAAEEESEEESEEEDDGLFDTSYVDVVTSGEVKLAYIPDSPTLPEDGQDDPFDTSIADSIVKEAERERLRKPVVSLGIAVDVLTGKVPVTSPCLQAAKSPSKRAPRKTEVDLLLGSFDENGNTEISVSETVTQPSEPKSLLDDLELETALPLLGEAPAVVAAEPRKKEEEREEKEDVPDVKNLLAEFDLIASVPSEPSCEVVAAVPAVLVATTGGDDDFDLEDEFAALAARKGSDAAPVDPFDTTAAAVVLGEDAHASDSEVAGFTSRAPPQQQRSPRTFPISPDVDIVLASDSPPVQWTAFDDDVSGQQQQVETFPEEHVQALAEDIGASLADPFDTSFAENILPGKVELKLIEDEILGGRLAVNEESILLRSSESDVEEQQVFHHHVQSSVSIHITDPAGCDRGDGDDGLTSLTLGHRDLLGGSTTDLSKLAHEPIEPLQPQDEDDDGVAAYADPFDTSVVDVIAAPGRTELKYIEQELLGETAAAAAPPPPKRKLSDPDFDPRAAEAIVEKVVVDAEAAVQKQRPDLLLTQPQQQPKVVAFDLPTPTERPDLLAVGVEEAGKVISKPLTPYYTESKPVVQGVDLETSDPFDTSFAENIAPGKAELRILESELVGGPSPAPLPRSLSDPDFDPRGEEARDPEPASRLETDVRIPQGRRLSESPATAPSHPELSRRRFSDLTGSRTLPPPSSLPIAKSPRPDLLLVEEEEAEVVPKPLTPQPDTSAATFTEADPFDTSTIPDAILPGRAELKVLESELIDGSQPLSLKRSYTDPDFNPREDSSAPQQAPAAAAVAERPDLLDLPDGEQIQAPHKPLTPAGEISTGTEAVIDDPFDTSIVGNLVPGRAELRILESELIGQ